MASRKFAQLFDPAFSPDGSALMLCGVDGNSVVREVVALDSLR
jgi:hypothetical protein